MIFFRFSVCGLWKKFAVQQPSREAIPRGDAAGVARLAAPLARYSVDVAVLDTLKRVTAF